MDGIKKRIPLAPPRAAKPLAKKEPVYLPPEEDLFIFQNEIRQMKKDERFYKIKSFAKKAILYLVTAVLLSAVSWFAYFSWKTSVISGKMNDTEPPKATVSQYLKTLTFPIGRGEKKILRGQKEGRINILLLGAAGKNKPGGNLTDTIMVMSVNTKDGKVALLSLPRDLYVPVANTASFVKINSLYSIGVKEETGATLINDTVEKILDIPIHYYLVIDFEGFVKIIDELGGINVNVERDIYDTRYPGPNYSYETFKLSKGLHKLDGATALKYVRERHNDPEGDFGRAKRQQQVIQAVKNKAFSAKTLLDVVALNNILNALGENIKTNIAFDEIESFLDLSKKVNTQNVTNIVVDAWKKDSLLKVSHVMTSSGRMFILVPRVGNFSQVQDLAKNIFNQDEIKKRREAIAKENANIAIINKSGDPNLASKIRDLLRETLGMKEIEIIPSVTKEIVSKTTVKNIHAEKNIFTLDELIKRIPASLEESDAREMKAESDIIITLGSDIIDAYKYEEDSIEDFQKYQNSSEYDN
ncbi:MAG TPA: LCP family protein [Candidatus Moranbacteria bacterium]|jgi:LCP family protein required for cell wall assembly|nr:LCP family protein [Candidatus Moranbacteria bacterium]HPX94352.1 LCP family protein [Candidatus Moranbacteria bacterium]HQB59481.1 LCP family protein [Candidatus Moranbacteria bacterium]